jgi:DNA polymerase
MANAMMLAHEGGTYSTIMSVHDELVCEVPKNEGSIDEFEALMSSVPPWAHGCPIAAEAERLTRYKK